MLLGFISTRDDLLAPRDTHTHTLDVQCFPVAARGTLATRSRANDARGSHFHAQRHSHACPARRAREDRAQDRCRTPKSRRTRPCAVHERALTSTAGRAGVRRAQGAHNYMLGAQARRLSQARGRGCKTCQPRAARKLVVSGSPGRSATPPRADFSKRQSAVHRRVEVDPARHGTPRSPKQTARARVAAHGRCNGSCQQP